MPESPNSIVRLSVADRSLLPARVHRCIYIVLLILLGGCMVTSTWASNLMWVLLGVNWLLEGRWHEKWQMAKTSRLLHFFVLTYVVMLCGMLWTSDIAAGFEALRVALPLLAVPLVVLTSQPVVGRTRWLVIGLYSATVLVVSAISAVRLFADSSMPYRDAVPYISHIRFALNCCMVIVLLCASLRPLYHRHRAAMFGAVLLVVWLLFFLLLIRSFTGFAALALTSLIFVLVYRRRWYFFVVWLSVAIVACFAIGRHVYNYYHLSPLAIAPLPTHTASGHPYTHACDGIVENGNYINNYVCSEELRSVWNQHSSLPYDSLTLSGYSVESTLVRYLNSLGLTKDSAGLSLLTDDQISDVERGVANHVYVEPGSLRKMVYVFLLEYEFSRSTHAVVGFTMLQRFELWKAAMRAFVAHPIIGVGTGDVVSSIDAVLVEQGSSLAGSGMKTHSQYLLVLLSFGAVGFLLLLFGFCRAVFSRRLPAVAACWLIVVLVSFFTEDTLATLAGILFCTWFLPFVATSGIDDSQSSSVKR